MVNLKVGQLIGIYVQSCQPVNALVAPFIPRLSACDRLAGDEKFRVNLKQTSLVNFLTASLLKRLDLQQAIVCAFSSPHQGTIGSSCTVTGCEASSSS